MASSEVPIVDVDTHIIEPPDTWTSRVSSKWGDLVPYIAWGDGSQVEAWYIGDAVAKHIEGGLSQVADDARRKILYENAAKLYGVVIH